MPFSLTLFTFYAHCGDLDRYAVSNRTVRDVFVHKAEGADNRIHPYRHSRHNDAMTPQSATFFQPHRSVLLIDGRDRVNGAMRPDLHIFLNGYAIFCIYVAESADVRFITQVQTADILNHPVVLGRLPLLDLRILPIFKSRIDITFIAIYGGVWQAPPPMFRNLLILLHMLLRLQQRRHR